MDLSFINLPESKSELLAVLNMAFNAGQQSMEAKTFVNDKTQNGIPAIITHLKPKSGFNGWLSRLANQWSNAQD